MVIQEVPEYMLDWDYEENEKNGLFPDMVTVQSRKRVYWRCHVCSGQWNTQAKERRGCPYCNNFKALPGYNDLVTTHPKLSEQWDYEKNGKLLPENVTHGSQKKVFWKCNKGHSWDAQVNSRVAGQGCPYCNNRRVLIGYNDLATVNPDLAQEWNYEKNNGLRPSDVIAGSKKKVWWQCSNGHSWQAQVIHRNNGTGCPVCAHKIVVRHYNDLGSECSELLDEWDYGKNIKLPSEYAAYSRKKVWWICKKGHSWQAAIGDRSRGNGCPKCSEERRVSFPEKAIFYYISKHIKGVESNYRAEWLKPYELDIFIPEYKIGIEYDGIYGHATAQGLARDIRKNIVCSAHGIRIIRIREYGCQPTESYSIDYMMGKDDKIEDAVCMAVNATYKMLDENLYFEKEEIDLDRDAGAIYSLIDYSEKENSLQNKAPEIAALWHPTKNGRLSPELVSVMSSKKVWWKGTCGHEWKSSVAYEATSGLCPYCSGKRVLIGFNDLATVNPEITMEWDSNKNDPLIPQNVTAGSGKKVWWKCAKEHSWNASIVSRNRGNGCPICANRIALKGYNDITSVPKLLEDWDYKKNDTAPEDVCIGSEKKVWWVCHVCGWEWKAGVDNRYRGSGCPECVKLERRKNVAKTYVGRSGSLVEKQPDLLREWDFEKNIDFSPEEVTCGSTKKVWWICEKCGNGWRASVTSRSRKNGGGCPKCGNIEREKKRRQKRVVNKGSITITHSSLIEEWDIEKNKGLSPDEVTSGSGRKVWWHCSKCGGEWQAVIYDRCRNRAKCPYCKNRKYSF